MDVFEYIKTQENVYNTTPVPVVEGYEWKMERHIKLTTLYTNSKFETGGEEFEKPFKNIIRKPLNLQHRAVDFDVKDIDVFADDPEHYYKSFLVKKFHERWAKDIGLNKFLNNLSATFTDFGGVLAKKVGDSVEVVPWQRIAFVDQTDIMSGPICEKHQMTPEALKEMESKGWQNIDDIIILSQNNHKETTQSDNEDIKVPGKYVEVYELHGMLPKSFLDEEESDLEFTRQVHIVAFYKDEDEEKHGITLFSGKEKENRYKTVKRDAEEAFGRALGIGAVEELFEAQVWVNYSAIQRKEMLDQATKTIYQTADEKFSNYNSITEIDNGAIMRAESPISQVNTQPINYQVFQSASQEWETLADQTSAAGSSVTGDSDKSGVPFRLELLRNQEQKSLHEHRKKQLGILVEEIYMDWVIPELINDMKSKKTFSATLTLDELKKVGKQAVNEFVNDKIKDKVLSGMVVTEEDIDGFKQVFQENFANTGDKKFFEVMEGELDSIPMDVSIIVTDEQKNLALLSDRFSSIFGQILANPEALGDPRVAKIFNTIIEASGISPINFGALESPKVAVPTPTEQAQVQSPVVDAELLATN